MERVNRVDHALYQQAVALYLKGDDRALDKFLGAQDLKQFEKNLILARRELRSGQLENARKILEGMSTAPTSFLEAEKFFLLSNLEFQNGNFEKAATCNYDALEIYDDLDDRRGQFLAHYNLSADFNRLGLSDLSLRHLNFARGKAQETQEEVLVLRALACHFSNRLEFGQAISYLEKALDRSNDLGPADALVTQNVAADIYFRAGEVEMARTLLKKVHRNRLNREKDRSEFELALLEKVLMRTEKLRDPAPVIARSSEYSRKWRLIRALQSGELLEARRLWQEIVDKSPDEYGEDFSCKKESLARSIFMSVLTKLLAPDSLQQHSEIASSHLEKLEQAIRKSRIPLRKEELIERVWNTTYDPSLDPRFYRLISRLKSEAGLNVLCIQRTYRIAETPRGFAGLN